MTKIFKNDKGDIFFGEEIIAPKKGEIWTEIDYKKSHYPYQHKPDVEILGEPYTRDYLYQNEWTRGRYKIMINFRRDEIECVYSRVMELPDFIRKYKKKDEQ